MDKTNNRKIRIAAPLPLADFADMSEETCDALFNQAADLAYQTFDDVTDEHVEAIYHRLALNHQWGAGDDGVVTVH